MRRYASSQGATAPVNASMLPFMVALFLCAAALLTWCRSQVLYQTERPYEVMSSG